MASLVKYRIHELAKDFGLPTKDVSNIVGEFFEKPKNHMQVLEDDQLNLIFDYITYHNQIDSIEEILAEASKAPAAAPAPVPAPEPEAPVQAAPAPQGEASVPVEDGQKAQAHPRDRDQQPRQPQAQQAQQQPRQGQQQSQQQGQQRQGQAGWQQNQPQGQRPRPQGQQGQQSGQQGQNQQRPAQQQPRQGQQQNQPQGQRPQAQSGGQAQGQVRQNPPQAQGGQQQNQQYQKQKQPQAQPQRQRERRVVDTSAATVNANRFDERVEEMVPEKVQNLAKGKEKFSKKSNKKTTFQGSKVRNEEQEKFRRLQLEIAKKQPLKVSIPDEISVGELALRMKKTGAEVVKQLIKLGVMASVSQVIDFETAAIVAEEMGCKVEKEVVVTIEERLIDDSADKEADLVSRSPVVVVMGHVDHGKTSLLDKIRSTNVVSAEAGGITQHIGAYRVEINGSPITFLDTPGHEAFTSMRARGAMVTDIAILVVAADDGIMPQTVEAISHAKAAKIPIVVAVNKMDKPGANPDKIMQQLTEYELVPEQWGGDTIICPISAKTGLGIDNLLENLVLMAEMQELKANPKRAARGTVIEARLDKGRGPVTTVLVQNGTLKDKDIIIAGTAVGRVRAMTDDKGNKVEAAGPSVPVEIIGMSDVPMAGDPFYAVEDERMARELVEQRKSEAKESASGGAKRVTLDDLFAQIRQGEMKELNIVVKADVQGSSEAVKASLEKLTNEEVRVKVIHNAVGAISESDILLASTANAIVVGFNVRPDNAAAASAARSGVDMRMYRVIYDCINEIEAAMKGMLDPKFKEVVTGHAEVRKVYKVSGVGTIAGCYVKDGTITRSAGVRVVRDGIVVHEGHLASLRRFKDDVKEVATNYECGMSIEKFNDIKEGDIFECFVMEQIKS